MATALATDLQAGRISVRDEPHRSQVIVPADTLFQPDTTRVASAQLAMLERVAQALSSQGGHVLVTAHARPDAKRSARLPSAVQLADEWARHVAQVLERRLPADSVASEGLVMAPNEPADGADQTVAAGAGGANTARRNRIEITLFP